jgi:hypothetical protein
MRIVAGAVAARSVRELAALVDRHRFRSLRSLSTLYSVDVGLFL